MCTESNNDNSDLSPWVISGQVVRADITDFFDDDDALRTLQEYEEDPLIEFDAPRTRALKARLWELWTEYAASKNADPSEFWIGLCLGKSSVYKHFQTFLTIYVRKSKRWRPVLGPEEWEQVQTIRRATTLEFVWANLVAAADKKVMESRRQDNPATAHIWNLKYNSKFKSNRNASCVKVAEWIGHIAPTLGLSLTQLFTKREVMTEDVIRILDTLWTRASHIPCEPSARLAFTTALLFGAIGGWRPGSVLQLKYKHIEFGLQRSHVDTKILRPIARITIEHNKQKKGKIQRDQSSVMSFDITLVPCQQICLLTTLIAQAVADQAFDDTSSVDEILRPTHTLPEGVNYTELRLKTNNNFLEKQLIPISYEVYSRIWNRANFVTGLRDVLRPYSVRVGAGGRLDGQ
jgi:hypothetical protein